MLDKKALDKIHKIISDFGEERPNFSRLARKHNIDRQTIANYWKKKLAKVPFEEL